VKNSELIESPAVSLGEALHPHCQYPQKRDGKPDVLERQTLLAEVVTCDDDHVKTSELIESHAVSLDKVFHSTLPLST